MGEVHRLRVEQVYSDDAMTHDRLQYLLDRYLDKQATPAEEEEIEQWYARQQQEAGLLDKDDKAAVAAWSQPLLQQLHQQMAQAATPVHRQPAQIIAFRKVTVAAAIIAVGSLCILFWQNNRTASRQVAAVTVDSAVRSRPVQINNTSDTIQQYQLKDGSVISLAANSRVEYQQPFTNNKRDIWLKGKALFKVAKDASRPFTVYSGDISTTALGTVFTITAFDNEPQVKVQLHEGKVVVKSITQKGRKPMADAFLLPGQELAYHIQTATSNIYKQSIATDNKKNNHAVKLLPPGSRTGMEATFEQEPLVNVLQQLAKSYRVRLQYNVDDLQYMDYSGQINKQDSLAKVINRIALLHRLVVIQTRTGYRIGKKQ